MADWFKLHENWFHEPRLQWAIGEQGSVVTAWLWILTECCRTKSDTIGLHSEGYEMIGVQKLLNVTPGLFTQALNLLEKIRYIEISKTEKTIKVLKWNDFQSDYLRKKGWRESNSVRQSPTKSDSVVLEERRGEDISIENPLKAVAIQVVSYLNQKAGTQYRETSDGTLKPVLARLKSGASLVDCQSVIDLKVKEWKSTDYAKYLRPSTLFGAEKFESYLGIAKSTINPLRPKLTEDGCELSKHSSWK